MMLYIVPLTTRRKNLSLNNVEEDDEGRVRVVVVHRLSSPGSDDDDDTVTSTTSTSISSHDDGRSSPLPLGTHWTAADAEILLTSLDQSESYEARLSRSGCSASSLVVVV